MQKAKSILGESFISKHYKRHILNSAVLEFINNYLKKYFSSVAENNCIAEAVCIKDNKIIIKCSSQAVMNEIILLKKDLLKKINLQFPENISKKHEIKPVLYT